MKKMFSAMAVFVFVLAPLATAQNAVPYNSAEAQERLQQYRDKMQRQKEAGRNVPPSPSKLTAKELQDIRDEVIASRAVAKYMMEKEGLPETDRQCIDEYINHGHYPAQKSFDSERVRQTLEKEEVKAWIKAEGDYQTALHPTMKGGERK